MVNPVATEAVYSATYVENYIDSVENLPDDLQRKITRIREIDLEYGALLGEVDHYYDLCQAAISNKLPSSRYKRAVQRMHTCIVSAQELGDEKMQLVNLMQEIIDQKARQLDTDKENLDIREDIQQSQLKRIQQGTEIPIPVKQPRTQSPTRSDLATNASVASAIISLEKSLNLGTKETNNTSYNNYGLQSGTMSGGVTKNIDGSVNMNTMGLIGLDGRSNKRSRRRNDTVNSAMEFSIENNSTNEGINNNNNSYLNERPSSSRAININNQKKSTNQQQAVSGNNANSGNNIANVNLVPNAAGGNNSSGKKKKRKTRGSGQSAANAHSNFRENTPPLEAIDPDEPTYCTCNQISYGEMILCDNDLCPIEWFHFSCVSLAAKPKGKWYCPKCRGDRPNTMKPKALFLKELERYNKEKEEKT